MLNSCCLVSALTTGLADELDKVRTRGVARLCGSLCDVVGAGLQSALWRAQDCAAQLQSIYDNYYGPPAGTICHTAIQSALTEADPALCPPSNVTVPCFNVRPAVHATQCGLLNVLNAVSQAVVINGLRGVRAARRSCMAVRTDLSRSATNMLTADIQCLCAQQAQTQWMAFVTTCDVFYWSDYSRDPVISPVIVPGTGSSSSSSSSSGSTIAVPSTGNNAEGEGRRLLQNTCGVSRHAWLALSRQLGMHCSSAT